MAQLKVLFTGGQGFVGQHVSRRLLKQGHEVHFYNDDILNSAKLFKKLAEQKYQFIVHLAGISSVPQGESDIEKLFSVNQLGTNILLEGIKAHCPEAHLVFSSSAQVYDSHDFHSPLTEDSRILPMNAYARSKYLSELLIKSYSQFYNVTATVFRIFNHTHKTHHQEFFLPSIYQKCLLAKEKKLQTQEITVGNLDLVRDISPIQRMMDIFEKYVVAEHHVGSYKVFNVCSSSGLNLKTLALKLGNEMGIDLKLVQDPARFRKNDPQFFVGDNRKILDFLKLSWPKKMNEEELAHAFLEDIE